ncbi:MAG: tetrahydrofolate dehydrogenase/cyclohydrolase catalytic domain-containing protein [Bacilli bacterium]|nr:tetrahydrofolate dehydrogenase/cyclohydrolase catalytic domain-containing protein [Bacilli bacterium]
MNNVIDGTEASRVLRNNVKKEIVRKKITPSLTVIQIGDNKASDIYVRNKKKACEEVGIKFELLKFNDTISQDVVINEIKRLNDDVMVNGILVQLPLPIGFDEGLIINSINPVKDVDGLTYQNVGNLVLENDCLAPCTPLGVMELLDMYNVNLSKKNVCLIGRSNLVGKPLIQMLLKRDATVSICHSKSVDIKNYTKMADVLIVAAGHPNLVTKNMVKDGAVVIDVGINKENDYLCGDVDFKEVSKKASLITPVPRGVGPMTVACLLKNVVKAYEIQH